MKMKTIRTPKVQDAPPQTWSNCKVCGDHVYIAGMTGSGEGTYAQAKTIFQQMKDLLEAAGGKMDDLIAITVFVTNLDENTEVWRARREFFSGDFPCSTLIEVKRVGSPKAQPPLKVEINAVGFIGAGG
jgi:enamine deaminase RidA (YjgF/YER057c/UK114 family)